MTTKHTLTYLAKTTNDAVVNLTTIEAKFRANKYTNRADLTSLAITRLRAAHVHLEEAVSLYTLATKRGEPDMNPTDKRVSVIRAESSNET